LKLQLILDTQWEIIDQPGKKSRQQANDRQFLSGEDWISTLAQGPGVSIPDRDTETFTQNLKKEVDDQSRSVSVAPPPLIEGAMTATIRSGTDRKNQRMASKV